MDSRHLKCFLHVLEAGGLSQASQRMHLTQSALSRQIRQLEEHLGVPLFERTGRGLVPTEAGQRLEPRARAVIADLDRLETEVAQGARGVVGGSLVIAVSPSLGAKRPASLIRDYRARYPEVRLRVIAAMSGVIQDGLLQGRLDLGVLHHPLTASGLISEQLWREPLWLVADPGANLAAERPIHFTQAVRDPIVLPGPRHGLRMLVQGYAAATGLGLRIAVEADSLRIMLELVAQGVGHTFLPRSAIEAELALGRLSAAPIVAPEIERVTVLAWSESREPNRAAIAMADLIREQWQEPV